MTLDPTTERAIIENNERSRWQGIRGTFSRSVELHATVSDTRKILVRLDALEAKVDELLRRLK